MCLPSALKKHKLTGDTSVMTYRGHGVLHTLIRCRFSPEFSTGQRFIYSGCSTGKIISESGFVHSSTMCTCVVLHHLAQSCVTICIIIKKTLQSVRVIRVIIYNVSQKEAKCWTLYVCSLRRADGSCGLQTVWPWCVCEGYKLAPVRRQHHQQLCKCC